MTMRAVRGGWLAALALALLALGPAKALGQAVAQATAQTKAPDAEQFVGAPQGKPLVSPELDVKTQQLAAQLRCPVCQGLAIGDSPSEMAQNMKHQVRELLARGFTEEQILRYFERSYGQFVLLKPKFQGVNSLVWILPIAVLALGALIVFAKARKLEAHASPTATRHEPSAASDPSAPSDPYLDRVRDLVKKA